MCIAICQPEGVKTLSRSVFDECARTNDDGLGMAWIDWSKPEGQRLRIWRSTKSGAGKFDVAHFHEKYRLLHHQFGKRSPFILHFRYTTHGETNQDNCHPFRVKPNLAMVHNGILTMPNKGQGIKNLFHSRDIRPEYSDTWHYANLYFPKFDYLDFHAGKHWFKDGQSLKEHTEDFIGTGNKLVFLDANEYDEETRKQWGAANYVIYNEKQGVWDGGTWFSNCGYRCYTSGYQGRGSWRGDGWEYDDGYSRDWGKFCQTPGCQYWCQRSQTHCWKCREKRAEAKTVQQSDSKPDPQHTDTKYYGSTTRTITYCRRTGCDNTTMHPNMHYCDGCLVIVQEENKKKKAELNKQIAEEKKCSESQR